MSEMNMKSSQSDVLSFRLLMVWLAVLMCHMYIIPAQGQTSGTYYSPRHYNADFINCQNVSEIIFLGFFPCLRQNGSGFEASKSISECDLLVEAAAHLAVERVNQNPGILPNVTLRLYPIYVPNGGNPLTVSRHCCYTTLYKVYIGYSLQ